MFPQTQGQKKNDRFNVCSSQNPKSALKAKRIFFILDVILKNLKESLKEQEKQSSEGQKMHRMHGREIFYLTQAHFGAAGVDQITAEKRYKKLFVPLIGEICILLQTSRLSMNVTVPSRGEVIGRIILCIDDTYICCKDGRLVPENTMDVTRIEQEDEIKFVLIVEKLTMFSKLRDMGFNTKYKCIVVSPSGHADLSTRSLVRKLSEEFRLPLYALGDLNAGGANIIRTFMFGSENTAHYNLNLCVPHLQWIGVFDHDVFRWMGPLADNVQLNLKRMTKADREAFNKFVGLTLEDTGLLTSMTESKYQVDMDILFQHVNIEEYLMEKIPEMNDG